MDGIRHDCCQRVKEDEGATGEEANHNLCAPTVLNKVLAYQKHIPLIPEESIRWIYRIFQRNDASKVSVAQYHKHDNNEKGKSKKEHKLLVVGWSWLRGFVT